MKEKAAALKRCVSHLLLGVQRLYGEPPINSILFSLMLLKHIAFGDCPSHQIHVLHVATAAGVLLHM